MNTYGTGAAGTTDAAMPGTGMRGAGTPQPRSPESGAEAGGSARAGTARRVRGSPDVQGSAEQTEPEPGEDGAAMVADGRSGAPTRRDADEVARFAERFAGVMADAGFPRMPARVFVALLVTDSGRLTAADLTERLQVSPAAVSGAVRYLSQIDIVARGREPGSRRDYYEVLNDVWFEAVMHKDQIYRRWSGLLAEGIEALGERTPAGERMRETRAFFEFLQEEMPALVGRWREYRARLAGAR